MISYEPTCPILGVNVAVTNMDKSINFIIDNIENLRGQYICASNSHTVVTAHDDPSYLKVQNESAMVLPDGKPLSVYQKRHGHKEAEKASGPDIMARLTSPEFNQYRHFFYGSTKETLNKLEDNLKKTNPDIQISGSYAPPFRPLTSEEDRSIIELINESKPDFIWIGLGAPKQEFFMHEHKDKFSGVMFGVGAAFDFISGNVCRAPKWMQNVGLEWFYRLLHSPKRLFKRYLVTNTKFIFYTWFRK